MAGFFGFFDYTKPGPGVPKNAPPKARFFVFFEVLSRKFWKLIRLNIMFFLFNIPAIIGMFWASHFYMQQQHMDLLTDFQLVELRLILGAVFICIPVITLGPVQAGFTYVLRNFSREEHSFLWWDFKDATIANMKQSFFVCMIDFIVILIVGIDINFYNSLEQSSFMMQIASGMLILFFIIYLMMHLYIYPMMVTFKLNIRQLYKNAFIFALMKFFPNLLILILVSGLVLASFLYYTIIGYLLFPLITLSLTGLIINFYVYPKLKKYIIDRIDDNDEQSVKTGSKSDKKKIEGGRIRSIN